MKKFLKKIRNAKGFTLAELLIVVAIIAVLVAIAIPIFTTQLEKSREATDASNIRAAYAELMTAVLTEDYDASADANSYSVELKQQTNSWQNVENVSGLQGAGMSLVNTPSKGGNAVLTYTAPTATNPDGQVIVTFNAG